MAPLTLGRPSRLRLRGAIRPPGDKSISHRALILAALAKGSSRVTHLLDAADVRATADALRAFGAEVPSLAPSMYVVGRTLVSPREPVDCGNSGTTARLLAGVVAGARLDVTFVGDASLSARPMRRIAEPLRAMGARVSLGMHGGLPMRVEGAKLRGIEYESSVASAQVKSAILLAAVLGGARATLREPHRSRDHTERMLVARGVNVERTGNEVRLAPAQTIRPLDTAIPADPSSSAYFLALAALADSGELRCDDVCLNPTRTGFFRALEAMGGRIEMGEKREEAGEPVGSVTARPASLSGIEIGPDEVPAIIDELPLLACVAARAAGETVVRGASELRVKESDRIAAVVQNLRHLGADAEELEDGFRVVGTRRPMRGRVVTRGDHRIAMAFGILGALPENQIVVDDPDCVGVSYPDFWRDLQRIQQ